MSVKSEKKPGDLVIGTGGETFRVDKHGKEQPYISPRRLASQRRISTMPPPWVQPQRTILQSLGALLRRG